MIGSLDGIGNLGLEEHGVNKEHRALESRIGSCNDPGELRTGKGSHDQVG